MTRKEVESHDRVLEARELCKSFGSTEVLSDVDFSVAHSQVVGLVGENGAGKSTLLNILSGIIQPNRGEILLSGRAIKPRGYAEAVGLGVSRVFQEQALIPNIKVYENLLLSQEAPYLRWGQILRTKEMIASAQELMDEAGVSLDVRRTTSDLSFSKRQLIEIVRACLVPIRILGVAHPIVLLDEPTASLEKADEDVFFQIIDRMRHIGSLVFVSHRLTEVLSVCDKITVLKDGHVMATVDPLEANERHLHALMVGRERHTDYYHEAEQIQVAEQPIVFQTRNLTRSGIYEDVTLEVRAGEVLGIGGLLESGKSEFGKAAAGVDPPSNGEVRLGDGPWQTPEIGTLIPKGLGYVPAERLAEGMIAGFPVAWNLSLASGGDLFADRLGFWRSAREIDVTETYIERLGIKAHSANTPCSKLSGGNQQKVVLARWLCRDIKVLILDNPTRGVDAGAKEELYGLIRRLTRQGVAILLISDELLELIGLSNRIAIMQHGRVAAIVTADPEARPTEQELIELMLTSPSHRREMAA